MTSQLSCPRFPRPGSPQAASWSSAGFRSSGLPKPFHLPVSIPEAGRSLSKTAIAGNPSNDHNGSIVAARDTWQSADFPVPLFTRDRGLEGWLPVAEPSLPLAIR